MGRLRVAPTCTTFTSPARPPQGVPRARRPAEVLPRPMSRRQSQRRQQAEREQQAQREHQAEREQQAERHPHPQLQRQQQSSGEQVPRRPTWAR
mmetsp:Transcript_35347/g.97838  ORF Transcript_35347/g.97838 Transcript_35347/m.97838 type:complete len:94 (-) Transcript_35347:562-843(-)